MVVFINSHVPLILMVVFINSHVPLILIVVFINSHVPLILMVVFINSHVPLILMVVFINSHVPLIILSLSRPTLHRPIFFKIHVYILPFIFCSSNRLFPSRFLQQMFYAFIFSTHAEHPTNLTSEYIMFDEAEKPRSC